MFLNICEKIQFLSSIERDACKRKLVPFPASRCIVTVVMQLYSEVDIGMGIVQVTAARRTLVSYC